MKKLDSFGELLDEYFGRRDKAERIRQRTADIFRLLTNAENRLTRKIAGQKQDLEACADKDKYKKWGDLITANIWRLSRGMESAQLEDYYSDDCAVVTVPLDKRLTPQQNAQRYYKKYTKSKTAEVELAKQIKLAEAELEYIYTVFDSLTHAESENDILEIRDELYRSGYASRMKNYSTKKMPAPKPLEFRTDRRPPCSLRQEQPSERLPDNEDRVEAGLLVPREESAGLALCSLYRRRRADREGFHRGGDDRGVLFEGVGGAERPGRLHAREKRQKAGWLEARIRHLYDELHGVRHAG